MKTEMPDETAADADSTTRIRLIILGVLMTVLLISFILLSRWDGSGPGTQIAGTSYMLVTAINGLQVPLGVATDGGGNIYVSNTGAAEVRLYDADAALKSVWKQSADSDRSVAFDAPYGIAVDDARGRVYVADTGNVKVLDMAGDLQYYLASPPEALAPTTGEGAPRFNGVAVYQDRVFVTSRDGIYIFSAADGAYEEHWGRQGAGAGEYDNPNGIAVDPASGNIYVVDTNNWRVVALSAAGKPRWTVGRQDDGRVASPFHLPRSVAVGPDGLVYISDAPDRIVVLDQDGRLVSIIGERGSGDAQLNFPDGLAVTGGNRLIFADRENNRVQVWQLSSPLQAAADADVERFKKAVRNN